MTNVCFAEAIKLGHGNGDRLGDLVCHAPTMEIVSVFKGQTTRLRISSSKCQLKLERHLEYFRTLFFLWPYYEGGHERVA